MANYDIPVPASLDSLDATQPLGGESGDKTDDILRQTRSLIKDVMLKEHNADGTHKGQLGAVFATSDEPILITSAQISSSSSDNDKRAIGEDHLKTNSVTTAKINALAVDNTKLATDSVITAKIQNDAVTTSKIADNAVTTAKIPTDAVTAAELRDDAATDGNRAVTSDHIRDSAITTAKINDNAVDVSKLAHPGANKILIGDGSSGEPIFASVAGVIGVVESGGVATFSNQNFLNVPVMIARTNDTDYTWVTGTKNLPFDGGDDWDLYGDTSILGKSGDYLTLPSGTYLMAYRFDMFADGFNTSGHFGQLKLYNQTTDPTFATALHTSAGFGHEMFVSHTGVKFGVGLITLTVASNLLFRLEDNFGGVTRNSRAPYYLINPANPQAEGYGFEVMFLKTA